MTVKSVLNNFFGRNIGVLSIIGRIIILFVAVYCGRHSVSALFEYDMAVEDLVTHKGTLETIEPLEYWKNEERITECKLKLQGDSDEYLTLQSINVLTDHLNIGDTISVYTKKRIFGLANFRESGSNSISWATPPNEIYHLTKNEKTIIDFQEHRQALIPHLIAMSILSILFFIWFFGRLPFTARFTSS